MTTRRAPVRAEDCGLSAREAAARLEHYGRSDLVYVRGAPLSVRFLGQFVDLFAVVLIVASGLTFLAYGLDDPPDPGNLQLAFAILAVVVLDASDTVSVDCRSSTLSGCSSAGRSG